MSEDTSPEDTTEVETEDTSPESEDTSPEDEDSGQDTVSRSELTRAVQARDKAKAKARELTERLKALESDKDAPAEPSPEERANAKIVRSATRAALAGAGITDKAVQGTIVKHLDLSGVEVDEDGEPDEDAIDEIVKALQGAFGTKAVKGTRTVSTRPGGSKETADPDTVRYREFLNRR